MTSKEIFETLELSNTKTLRFKNADEYKFQVVTNCLFYYTFLVIEIQSSLPPTDCIFKMSFYTHQSNSVRSIKLHSMECRKDFIFENGLYLLYLDSIKIFHDDDMPKDLVPIDFNFTNKRDTNSSCATTLERTTTPLRRIVPRARPIR